MESWRCTGRQQAGRGRRRGHWCSWARTRRRSLIASPHCPRRATPALSAPPRSCSAVPATRTSALAASARPSLTCRTRPCAPPSSAALGTPWSSTAAPCSARISSAAPPPRRSWSTPPRCGRRRTPPRRASARAGAAARACARGGLVNRWAKRYQSTSLELTRSITIAKLRTCDGCHIRRGSRRTPPLRASARGWAQAQACGVHDPHGCLRCNGGSWAVSTRVLLPHALCHPQCMQRRCTGTTRGRFGGATKAARGAETLVGSRQRAQRVYGAGYAPSQATPPWEWPWSG